MEFVNKLKNTVSGALPGNPLTREYEIFKQIGTSGPDLLWKVYSAKKKSTKQEASVWVLEKKMLDVYGKQNKELVYGVLKQGVYNLTRIRHPKILSVLSPAEESRESLAFATEPIYASLSNILYQRNNLPESCIDHLRNFDLEDVEIKYGILQIVESLVFLHNDANKIHRNISPQSIIVNKRGSWKLGGMDFIIDISESNPEETSVNPLQSAEPSVCKPSFKYTPPESGIDRVCIHKIFPQLCEEFTNQNMVPFVLPSVLLITDMSGEEEFNQYIMPKLVPVMVMKEPIQIVLILLQNLKLFMSKFKKSDFSTHALPMLNAALDADNRAIQELCLNSLPEIADRIEYSVMKSHLVPRIKRLCLRTSTLPVKVQCLMCIGKIMQYFDKWFIIDEILPLLSDIKCRDPTVMMAVYAIYRIAASHKKLGLSREVMATKVLPTIIPMSIDLKLNVKQYGAFAALIAELCAKLESEQRTKLERSGHIKEPNDTLLLNPDAIGEISDSGEIMKRIMDEYTNVDLEVDSNKGFKLKGKTEPEFLAICGTESEQHQTLALGYGENYDSKQEVVKPAPAKKNYQNLSLEEKRRLAGTKSNSNAGPMKLTSGKSIDPISFDSSSRFNNSQKPVDLTHTLLENNLKSLALPSTTSTPTPSMNLSNNWSSNANQPVNNQKPNYNINLSSMAPNQNSGNLSTMYGNNSSSWGNTNFNITAGTKKSMSSVLQPKKSANVIKANILSTEDINDLLN